VGGRLDLSRRRTESMGLSPLNLTLSTLLLPEFNSASATVSIDVHNLAVE
jgi:hypothetical protein